MSLYERIPKSHEVGLHDEEDEAYYVGARQAVNAVVAALRENAAASVTGEAQYFNNALADKIERDFGARP